MADICPVCEKEITSENREVYKSSNYAKETALHDYCLIEFVSKPEGWFEEVEKEKNRIEKEEKDRAEIERKDMESFASEAKEQKIKESKIIDEKEELKKKVEDKSVYVKGFNMPFGEMVMFMVKSALASIPAFIILAIIGAIFFAMFGALLF
jgi:hypothetical protein